MAILPPVFRQRFFTASGEPLAGGKIYTYIAGTTTLQTTYDDATETSANANPIILDANGECDLWLGSSSYKIKLTDSADVEQWTVDYVNQSSIQSLASSDYVENLGITCATASNALTINIKTANGGVPGVGSPVRVGFRSSSLASGLVSLVEIISPLSMTISSGSTLGHSSGVDSYIYVYLINYNGVAEIAVSADYYSEASLVTTTAEGGAGGADSGSLIYSITARTNVPVRLVGRLTVNQATAGTWATMPSSIQNGGSEIGFIVDTPQIKNLAVTEAKLAASAVATAKIADGAVTRAKREAIGQQLSSSCNNYTSSSASATDITNLSVSITTTGKPVFLGLVSDGSGNVSNLLVNPTAGTTTIRSFYTFVRSGTTIAENEVGNIVNSSGTVHSVRIPVSSLSHIDVVAAGTYTYKVQVRCAADTGVGVNYAKLIAYEM